MTDLDDETKDGFARKVLDGHGDEVRNAIALSRLLPLALDIDLVTDDPFWETRDFPEIKAKLVEAREAVMEALAMAKAAVDNQ